MLSYELVGKTVIQEMDIISEHILTAHLVVVILGEESCIESFV